MNPATPTIYRDTVILSLRLHEEARRARARGLWALFRKLFDRFSLPHPAPTDRSSHHNSSIVSAPELLLR